MYLYISTINPALFTSNSCMSPVSVHYCLSSVFALCDAPLHFPTRVFFSRTPIGCTFPSLSWLPLAFSSPPPPPSSGSIAQTRHRTAPSGLCRPSRSTVIHHRPYSFLLFFEARSDL